MRIEQCYTRPFADQRPGTAGLRRPVRVFSQPNYLENFMQSVFDVAELPAGATLIAGGDGRHFSERALHTLIGIAAANGVARILVGRNGLLSTPAASHLIRHYRADGGFLLTASHNPGGPDGDFGIKFNVASGGQAAESLTDAIHARTLEIDRYVRATGFSLPALDTPGVHALGGLHVEVIDPVDDYAALMQSLFDFERIAALLAGGFRLRFDAMNAVTGPYANRLFGELLGAPPGSVLRAEPLPDFGGIHPDPNPVDAAGLVAAAYADDAPDLLAASDGDGDRNMILGPGCLVHPCDSLALLTAHHARVPGYRDGLPGVARSMPTSRAVDAVAAQLGIACHVTPTGWRFFCNLLEDERIGLCGEESFGTSSRHTREKDGLWAVLFWLDVLAATGRRIPELLREHWRRFGRHYYMREDWQIADADAAEAVIAALRALCGRPARARASCPGLHAIDEFSYRDPVDGSLSARQGIEARLDHGHRIVYRLSGTGTRGATLRIYLERFVDEPSRLEHAPQRMLSALGERAAKLARIAHYTGLRAPAHRI